MNGKISKTRFLKSGFRIKKQNKTKQTHNTIPSNYESSIIKQDDLKQRFCTSPLCQRGYSNAVWLCFEDELNGKEKLNG